MKICLFTQINEAFSDIADITMPILQAYADKNGYWRNIEYGADGEDWERSVVWDRYKIMAKNMDGYDILVHVDADVLITNHNVRIEDLLPDREQIVMAECMCEDGNKRLNDGVSIFKSSPYMKWLMGECFSAPEQDPIFCGQDVLQQRWNIGKLDGKLKIERQKAMNSFLYEEYGMPSTTVGNWTKGDLALHLPGVSNHRRVEILKDKVNEIIL